MKEQDKAKTAFTTPTGLFQFFTVMPFGLSGGGWGLKRFTGVYLDVIFSEMWPDHVQHVRKYCFD